MKKRINTYCYKKTELLRWVSFYSSAMLLIIVSFFFCFIGEVHADKNSLNLSESSISTKTHSTKTSSTERPSTETVFINSNNPIAVIISREIKPFIEMVEGLESSLDQSVVRIFIDQNSNPFSHDPLFKGTQIENYSFVVAVGPSALLYVIQNNKLTDDNIKKILYSMVLNPETIIPKDFTLCGVSLNIFSQETINKIKLVFPSIKKIGVLFDPANNEKWFNSAQKTGVFDNIEAVPINITEESDFNNLNKEGILNIDALLFIPDKTVTSPTIIHHIIKQSIARKIPVIGYNSFFHNSGAALSFILDYKKIGRQIADKIAAISRGEPCGGPVPLYSISLNKTVVELLNIDIGESLPPELKVE